MNVPFNPLLTVRGPSPTSVALSLLALVVLSAALASGCASAPDGAVDAAAGEAFALFAHTPAQ